MSNIYYLGIDTSCYTTSISLIDEENNIIYDLKEILHVKNKQKGLRQQEAIFQHMNNLPHLLKQIDKKYFNKIKYVSVSNKPRNVKESYMPVFLQGVSFAEALSHGLDVPIKYFSHQEGHLAAGLLDNKILLSRKFVAIHLSGGTNEILLVENNENMDINLLANTLDISFGQLIDRIGVYLGYNFPSGKYIDELSLVGKEINVPVPISLKNGIDINISGLENYFKSLVDKKEYLEEDISRLLMNTIAKYIEIVIEYINKEYDINDILLVGGVSESKYLRNLFKYNKNIKFARSGLSRDNAVGIAYLGKINGGNKKL